MPNLPILIRQNKVFELVVDGRSYAEICKRLAISEDTVARDMAAIAEQITQLATERTGEIVAVALATYQAVIDEAWRAYHAAERRELDWYAGRLDYTHESVVTKTLAVEGKTEDGAGDEDDDGTAFHTESLPLEVRRTRRTVRPALVGNDRRTWLTLIVDTTAEFTELLGVKKLIVAHQGGDKPIEHVHLTLDEWKAEASARLQAANETLALLDEEEHA
jgi:hypothetical protein